MSLGSTQNFNTHICNRGSGSRAEGRSIYLQGWHKEVKAEILSLSSLMCCLISQRVKHVSKWKMLLWKLQRQFHVCKCTHVREWIIPRSNRMGQDQQIKLDNVVLFTGERLLPFPQFCAPCRILWWFPSGTAFLQFYFLFSGVLWHWIKALFSSHPLILATAVSPALHCSKVSVPALQDFQISNDSALFSVSFPGPCAFRIKSRRFFPYQLLYCSPLI